MSDESSKEDYPGFSRALPSPDDESDSADSETYVLPQNLEPQVVVKIEPEDPLNLDYNYSLEVVKTELTSDHENENHSSEVNPPGTVEVFKDPAVTQYKSYDKENEGLKDDTPVLSAPGIPGVQPLMTVEEIERAEVRRLIAEKQAFACDECDTRFTHRTSLNRHKKRFHSENGKGKRKKDEQCHLCNKKLSSKKTLRSHIMTYHGAMFTCQVCSKPFYLESDFRSHSHGEKPHACDLCDKTFLYEIWLDRHRTAVHTKPFVCHICGKRFPKNCLLIRHVPVHTGEKRHECDVCSKTFKQKYSLTIHKQTHSGQLPFTCDLCERRFSSKLSLKSHIKGHSERQYQCEYCDKKFRLNSHLEYHRPSHYGDKPYVCESCNERFSDKQLWQDHVKVHDSKKKYKCQLCEKRFNLKLSLDGHVKGVHLKEKPFSCDVCGKRFALNLHFVRHSKTHM